MIKEDALPTRRRSQRFLNASDFLEEVRHLRIDWPSKSVRLERDSLHDHWQRSTVMDPAIAELYHENSKLFPEMIGELAAARSDVEQLREAVVVQRSSAMHRRGWPVVRFQDQTYQILEAAVGSLKKCDFFAFDLRLIYEEALVTFDPLRQVAYAIKKITREEIVTVENAITVLRPKTIRPDGILLFLVASFARNQMLYGPRGYRRTLVEAGGLIQHIVHQAEASKCGCTVSLEFHDRRIDTVIEADGIEEGTAAIIEIGRNINANNH